MTRPVLNEGIIRIKEGSVLSFRVLNIVKLQDNRDYYILEDQNGVKHFIDAEMYANFGIEVGKEVNCKVAKINCTGRILLEPIHPIYTEGQTYYFSVVTVTRSGDDNKMILEDIFKNKIEVSIPGTGFQALSPEKFVKCKVVRLKRGVPEIDLVL
jgi:hypothetical protein